jgi:uncharacterized membrane protein YbhN (UPF0104 family)
MIRIAWRRWRSAAYLLLIIIAIVLIALWWPELVGIWREQALTFVGAVIVMVCSTFVQARNFLVFLDVKHSVRRWRFARVWALSALANYVAPLQPGVAVRVGWLSHRGVNVTEGLLATWRQLIASIWIAMLGLAVGLLLTGDPRGRWPAFSLAVAWVIAFILRKICLRWLDRLAYPQWLANHRDLLRRAAIGITPSGLVGVIAQYVLGTLVLYWVYSRFGADIGVGQALILACLIYLSSIVSILPGNLGVTEAIYMLGGHGFDLSLAAAGALAILIRVAHVGANLLIALTGFRDDRDGSAGKPL